MNLKTINKVTDSSLGRLMNLLNDKTYAIITAYRDSDTEGNELSKQENLQRNRELRARFNANKMGVYSLVGHWQETHEVERCYVTIDITILTGQLRICIGDKGGELCRSLEIVLFGDISEDFRRKVCACCCAETEDCKNKYIKLFHIRSVFRSSGSRPG